MKNKIIVMIMLVALVIPMLNFVKASEQTLTKEEIFNLACEELKTAGHNYCIGTDINLDGNYTIYGFDYEPYIIQVDGQNYLCIKTSISSGRKYFVYYNSNGVNVHKTIHISQGGVSSTNLGNNYYQETKTFETYYPNTILTNFDLKDNNNNIFIGNSQDDTIGNPSSNLQLSYEYNEDYSECKINATLKNGQFTDTIFYSNYMPSISGQGLLTKVLFPRERNYS